jgi:FkbM family methyltransferase
MAAVPIKKIVRSALFHMPRLYAALTSEWRYVVAHKLGRVHEEDFRCFPKLVGGASPLIIDVGSNLGQSVLSTKRVLPNARIVGFEPNPANWPALDRMRRRFPDFSYNKIGLSDIDGESAFYCPVYNGKVMGGLASFDYESAYRWISGETVLGFRDDLLSMQITQLKTRRLDEFEMAPDIIKMDIQGYEEPAVRGAEATIRRHKPVLMIEDPTSSLRGLLAQWGYSNYEYYGGVLLPSRRRKANQFFLSGHIEMQGF